METDICLKVYEDGQQPRGEIHNISDYIARPDQAVRLVVGLTRH